VPVDTADVGCPLEPADDPVELLETGLARLGRRAPLARILLVALAWGKGPGLPQRIWVVVAQALLAGRQETRTVTRAQVRWLLRAAADQVVADTGPGGQAVYRLRHAEAAMYLRGEPSQGRAPRAAWQRHAAQTEGCITAALLAAVPAGTHGRDWARADPYLRTHLAQHAAAAGPESFVRLVRDTDFLAAADPGTIMSLMSVVYPGMRDAVRAYRRAGPLLGRDPAANAAYIAEATHALSGPPAVAEERADGTIRPWYRTRMASVRSDDSLLTLTGHTAIVYSVTAGATADGRLLLASGSDDGTIRLWEPFTGTPTRRPLCVGDAAGSEPSDTYCSNGMEVDCVAFGTAPDGRLLLASSGGDRTVRLWDPVTGSPIGRPLTGHTSRVWRLAFGTTPDGRLLLASGSRDLTVRIWDPLAGAQVGAPLTGHTEEVGSVSFGTAPDGRLMLASGSVDETVRIWDPLTGAPAGEPLTGYPPPVQAEFGTAPDGRLLLAIGDDNGVLRIWDPLAGTQVGELLSGHTDRVDRLVFGTAPDGRWLLASASRDSTIRLWDPLAGTSVGQPLTGHTGWVFSVVAFADPAGRLFLASGSSDTTVRIWDATTAASPPQRQTGHTRWVTSAAFGTAPGGQLLLAAGSGDATVRVWDALTGAEDGRPLTGHTQVVTSVATTTASGGQLLLAAGSTDTTVHVWDLLTREPAYEPLAGHDRPIRAVAFGGGPGGRVLLASASADATVRVWDAITGIPVGEPLIGHAGWVDAVAFCTLSGGGLLLATGGEDGTVRLWDPLTSKPVGEPLPAAAGVRALAFAARSRGRLLASGGEDGVLRLWDPLTGKAVGRPLTGHTGWVASVAFTTALNGRLLLASGGGDKTVRLWDPVKGYCLVCLRRKCAVRAVAAVGLRVAIGDDDGVSVIELDMQAIPRSRRAARLTASTVGRPRASDAWFTR
jgi:WD40 repeat protein